MSIAVPRFGTAAGPPAPYTQHQRQSDVFSFAGACLVLPLLGLRQVIRCQPLPFKVRTCIFCSAVWVWFWVRVYPASSGSWAPFLIQQELAAAANLRATSLSPFSCFWASTPLLNNSF